MDFRHIVNLTVSAANLRGKGKADIANACRPSGCAAGLWARCAARFASSPRTPATSDDADLRRKLEEAVASMPRVQREIFLAHRLDDLSYAEIASRTGLSVRQVEQHMASAIYKLVKQMDGLPLSWWERWF